MRARLKQLENEINIESSVLDNWKSLHDEVLTLHQASEHEDEYIFLLELYFKLMQNVESLFPDTIDAEKFSEIKDREYNMMLLRESTIGNSLCVETLYELTQRELEAGRMPPTHEFIDIAIQATASDHYSRDQLIRQKEKIKNIRDQSTFSKLGSLLSKL